MEQTNYKFETSCSFDDWSYTEIDSQTGEEIPIVKVNCELVGTYSFEIINENLFKGKNIEDLTNIINENISTYITTMEKTTIDQVSYIAHSNKELIEYINKNISNPIGIIVTKIKFEKLAFDNEAVSRIQKIALERYLESRNKPVV